MGTQPIMKAELGWSDLYSVVAGDKEARGKRTKFFL
jgi:hypothetical protein